MYQTEITEKGNLRENDILVREYESRILALENQVKSLITQVSSSTSESSIVNQIFNSDLTDSNNTRFESVAGSGNSAKELAYFFTHSNSATALTVKNALTDPADTVTSAIKESSHANFSSNIQNPRWDKENGVIVFGKTNTIDMPLGDFINDGQDFVAGHPLQPGKSMFVTFKLARKSVYIFPKGRIYCGIYNNKSGSEGWLKGANYGLTGAKRGEEVPLATVSAQYMIAIETDQGYTLVSDIVTIADSPALANFSPNCYNFLSWKYIAGTLRVRIFRKLGAGNVFEIREEIQTNSYQDKAAVSSDDTGSGSFPTFSGQKTTIESYWASTEIALQNVAVDGVAAEYDIFRVTLGISNTVNFSDVENPFLRIGLTDPAGIRVTDAITNSTASVTSAVAQFTTAMNGKTFTLENLSTGAIHTGTVTYVSPTEITLSSACPWSSSNNRLTIEDCIEDAFILDKIGFDFNRGSWTPRTEDTASRPQVTASNPNGSTQGEGTVGSGGIGGDEPIYGGGDGGYGSYERQYSYFLEN